MFVPSSSMSLTVLPSMPGDPWFAFTFCQALLTDIHSVKRPKKEASLVKKTARFVVWICSKFTREEIEEIIAGLFDVLANLNPEVKPKDDFKEEPPHCRCFLVDPSPPFKVPPEKRPKLNWKERREVSIYKYSNDRCPCFVSLQSLIN